MKKSVALLIALTFVFAGIGTSAYAGKAKVFLTMGTGGIAGTYYPFGGIVCSLITKQLKDTDLAVSAAAQSTGGSVDNINLMMRGQTELALAQNDVAYMAYNGVIHKAYKGKPYKKIRAIANLYPEVIHIVAMASSGINSVQDLKGKRVCVGDLGSGVEVSARDVVAAAGMTYKDFSKTEHIGIPETVAHMKDGQLDAFFMTSRVPVPGIQDLASMKAIKLVTLGDDVLAKMQKGKPWYARTVIPAGSYKGVNKDVDAVAIMCMLCTTSNISEELAYNISKAIFENIDFLSKAHAAGKFVSFKNALSGITIPLHKGAVKYYKEKGLKVPEIQ
ncbi:MAG: TAXI family TRAP transporter solute-binding subunit [Thermodesulfobacteriota bacterium]|nr:TAXI family TRAP transporter solute-binding subunit [Thermodesulfobacteriota bacterium]